MFYALPLYVAGFTQAAMWKQFNPDGTLVYGNFLETVTQIMPMYMMRAFGGTLYLAGFLLLAYNIIRTAQAGSTVEDELAEAAPLKKYHQQELQEKDCIPGWKEELFYSAFLVVIAIAIGGAVEIIPLLTVDSNIPKITSVKPYTPLELEGRDLYIREGCNNCHSQMIRPFRSEVERYGEYSKAGEFVYDFPFLWGSKRTGPDVHRVGGKYNDNWHFNHMLDPRSTSPGSIMPQYPWLITDDLDISNTGNKVNAMVTLGVPYSQFELDKAVYLLKNQAKEIENNLRQDPEFVKNYGMLKSKIKKLLL